MQNNYYYGIEIECFIEYGLTSDFRTNINRLNLQLFNKYKTERDFIRIDGDGSISPPEDYKGIEVKIGKATRQQLGYIMPLVCDTLDTAGASINKTCGLHVHTSKGDDFINRSFLMRLVKTWIAIEDVLMATQPKSRQNNRYCGRFIRTYLNNNYDKIPASKSKILDKVSGSERYSVLNLGALRQHGTIECRLHSGTVEAHKILNWVDLLTAIYEYVFNHYDTKKLDLMIKSKISDAKVKAVFKMLKLDKKLTEYFMTKRVKKFLFDTLAVVQANFIKAIEIKPAYDRARDAAYQATQAVRKVEQEYTRYFREVR